jgi:hypothetical protein
MFKCLIFLMKDLEAFSCPKRQIKNKKLSKMTLLQLNLLNILDNCIGEGANGSAHAMHKVIQF